MRDEELQSFARNGYFLRPAVLSELQVDALNARLSQLIQRCGQEHASGVRGSYDFWSILRGSRDDASVLWDTRSPMPAAPGQWEAKVMRVGHGLHLADPAFAEVVHLAGVGGVLAGLVPPPAVVVQSAVVYKQPASTAVQFGLHQDAAYLSTDPESLVLAFIALDDMDEENGALALVPGSHLGPRYVTLRLGHGGFEPVEGGSPREDGFSPVLLPMKKGAIAFVHGRTLHASGPNRSRSPRRSLIVHAMSAASKLLATSWVQPPAGGFEPLP